MKAVSIFILCVVCVGATILACFWYVTERERKVLERVETHIEETRGTLNTLAEQIDNGEVDPIIDDIIRDCRERQEFELLLGELHLLSGDDLLRAKQLFDLCGNYYAVRHSFMVSRVVREYEALKVSTGMYSSLSESSAYDELNAVWGTILELLREKDALFTEQVAIQGDIIDELILGKRPSDPEIQTLLGRARDIVELVAVADTKVDAQRERARALTIE